MMKVMTDLFTKNQ
jgi:hypothetical protein